MEISYIIPISEAKQEEGTFYIKGTALNSGVTGNNHEFTTEELSKSASTLKNVPLLEDHRNEVSAIRGRVINAYYNKAGQNIPFKARVSDKNVQELISRNDLNSVSVGADVKDVEETEQGTLRLKGVTFRELSLVAVGADEGASFATAIREAYESKKKNHTKSPSGNKTKLNKYQEDKMSEDGPSADNAGNEGAQENQGAQDTQNQATQSTEPQGQESNEELKEIKDSMKSMAEGLKTVTDELKSLKSKSNDESGESDEDSKKSDESKKSSNDSTDDKSNESDDEDEDEDGEESTESGNYRLVQGSGSIKGGAFTLIR